MRGKKSILVCPSPTVFDVHPLPKDEGYFGRMDSATSPFGSAQNDRVGIGMSESFRIRETKLKGVKYFKVIHWCFEHWFSLMLCSLFFIEAKCTGFLIDAEAKTKKDDLMVNDYDLEECESGKTRI